MQQVEERASGEIRLDRASDICVAARLEEPLSSSAARGDRAASNKQIVGAHKLGQ